MQSSEDKNSNMKQAPNRRIAVLIILLGMVVFSYLYQSKYFPDREAQTHSKNKLADHTGIDRLAVKAINFWEAEIEIEYSLESRHGNGYIALNMPESHQTVGVVTKAGVQSKGVALLSREFNRPTGHTVPGVRAEMYNPYRRDRSYYDEWHDLSLAWPDVSDLGIDRSSEREKFAALEQIYVYRNIPNYIEFARKLANEGVPAESINLQLAVCSGCAASVIFGIDVPIPAILAYSHEI